jgi:hypothetical protein
MDNLLERLETGLEIENSNIYLNRMISDAYICLYYSSANLNDSNTSSQLNSSFVENMDVLFSDIIERSLFLPTTSELEIRALGSETNKNFTITEASLGITTMSEASRYDLKSLNC